MADNTVNATIVDLAVTVSIMNRENLQEFAIEFANFSRATRNDQGKAKQNLDRSNAEIIVLKGLDARNVALTDQAHHQVDAIAHHGVTNQAQAAGTYHCLVCIFESAAD